MLADDSELELDDPDELPDGSVNFAIDDDEGVASSFGDLST